MGPAGPPFEEGEQVIGEEYQESISQACTSAQAAGLSPRDTSCARVSAAPSSGAPAAGEPPSGAPPERGPGRAAGAPPLYCPRQFDRSASYSSMPRNIELSARSGGGECCDGDSDSGSSSSSDDGGGGGGGRDDTPSTSGGGGAWGAAGFAPLEVEEPSTETAFVMRSLKEALSRKENECEHLRQIIKELSQSRARVHKTKVELEESYNALQKDYMRVVKVSELARAASQQSLSRSNAVKRELAEAKDAASRASRRAAAATDKSRRLKAANSELRARLSAAEALAARAGAMEGLTTSACMREFLATARAGLY